MCVPARPQVNANQPSAAGHLPQLPARVEPRPTPAPFSGALPSSPPRPSGFEAISLTEGRQGNSTSPFHSERWRVKVGIVGWSSNGPRRRKPGSITRRRKCLKRTAVIQRATSFAPRPPRPSRRPECRASPREFREFRLQICLQRRRGIRTDEVVNASGRREDRESMWARVARQKGRSPKQVLATVWSPAATAPLPHCDHVCDTARYDHSRLEFLPAALVPSGVRTPLPGGYRLVNLGKTSWLLPLYLGGA